MTVDVRTRNKLRKLWNIPELAVSDIAKILGVTEPTVRRWAENDALGDRQGRDEPDASGLTANQQLNNEIVRLFYEENMGRQAIADRLKISLSRVRIGISALVQNETVAYTLRTRNDRIARGASAFIQLQLDKIGSLGLVRRQAAKDIVKQAIKERFDL